jgi:hypothetical protein
VLTLDSTLVYLMLQAISGSREVYPTESQVKLPFVRRCGYTSHSSGNASFYHTLTVRCIPQRNFIVLTLMKICSKVRVAKAFGNLHDGQSRNSATSHLMLKRSCHSYAIGLVCATRPTVHVKCHLPGHVPPV